MTIRCLQPALLALVGVFVPAGCLQTTSNSCLDGGVCPPGLHCAMAGERQVCVLPTCGNNRLEPGEACDDGNNLSGDGCPADCRPACGDGTRDPGEACDDGNTIGDDGCSADCRSAERCGNGTLDPGEACDDGSLTDHDGCSSRCAIEQPVWSTTGGNPNVVRGEMAYDAARGVTVLVQNDNEQPSVHTSEWDGVAWRQRSARTMPAALGEASLIYDAANQRIVELGYDRSGWTAWAWDGIDWTEHRPGAAPPVLLAFALAYDIVRHKVVLFGGGISLPGGLLAWQDATWEWDGTTWTQVTTATVPPPRGGHAMGYDARRGVIVMYGGEDNHGIVNRDVWEYDGIDWRVQASSDGPFSLFGNAMVFEAARGAMALFDRNGLWEWDGGRWTSYGASAAPVTRSDAALAYDIARRKLVVFGGRIPDGLQFGATADTWEWDGTTWANRDVRTLARQSAAMAFCGGLGSVVVFGGDQLAEASPGTGAGLVDDTWYWNGAAWTAVPSPAAFPPDPHTLPHQVPAPRMGFAMAPLGDNLLLFGGLGANGVALSDTWLLSTTTWTHESVSNSPQPQPRSRHAMAYDAARGNVVLFGGAPQDAHVLNDTWTWDLGRGWVRAGTPHTPTQRGGHAMAFDSARQVVVMFGGQNGNALLADTWTWNGSDWTQQAPAVSPPARRGHAIAFDAARGKAVLFGGAGASGLLADTWEWDGATWVARTPATAPPARSDHVMAYDPGRGRIVMFGGAAGARALDDVWEWDGTRWLRVRYPSSPPARSHLAMTYDEAHATALMFGGVGPGGGFRLNDTWLWDGTDWHSVEPVAVPPARAEHALAFDAARGKAVLFGGADGAARLADTWEWDGVTWLEQHPTTSPPARRGHAMVYDVARGETLLFGGNASGGLLGDQWRWDGARWAEVAPATAPPRRTEFSLAYDADRERVVLFGGLGDPGRLADVWEWDGSAWVDRTPPTVYAPAARSGATMVYDAARRRVVVFGGQGDAGGLNDSWDWDGTVWAPVMPAQLPPPRHHQAMTYDASRGAIVMFGGDDGSALGLRDTWLMRFEDPMTSSQACETGVDSDGDGKTGCDDPDCAGLCTLCGDGRCGPDENCRLCPADCGSCSVCGDFQCDPDESCTACPADCGRCPALENDRGDRG